MRMQSRRNHFPSLLWRFQLRADCQSGGGVKLTEEGTGNIYCLAGIGAHIEGMVESARSAKRIVALDGCSVACAKKTIKHAGLTLTDWICVTEEGIDKVHEFTLLPEQIAVIARRTRESLAVTVHYA